ncbi:putative photosynthetic complex assembly protein PuhE [Jannaschia pohangensis]|uniref:Putative photosynthetic complex assembly protein 2 n=1 Tax=Jannaschia pohangensis TaxID=390807 RepID=A0A1I3UV24_9RHOB|nr:putative photosynthetic complex assembly protein PuhE [Jannaschia pohangensis]SFJ85707.1 putative photosynthetic complex assembly protein 2 [Jannaschia pohangensis]
MFETAWIAALVALFAWWFSTGAILLLVRRSDISAPDAHGRSVVLTVPFLALGVAALVVSAEAHTVANVYLSFAAVLLIWGWIELAFLAGVVTGPERRPCPPGLSSGTRFLRAWTTVSHHELALLIGFFAVVIVTVPAENTIALWSYGLLLAARISAKLNLFFGVPHINTEFVPRPLAHLKSYFRTGPITAAFPIGVVALCLTTAWFGAQLAAATSPAETVGFALLTALAGLAALEHWLMVIPLPDAKLWSWMMPAPTTHHEGTDP